MTMERCYDAVVLGAGVAGSSMAGALAARGWRTLVLDRADPPVHKVCGEFLSPESRGSLEALGLSGILDSLPASPIDAVRLVSATGRSSRFSLPVPALGVSRPALDGALLGEAAKHGAELRKATTALSVTPEGRQYRIEARGREGLVAYRSRAVIGAWGRNAPAGLADEIRRPAEDGNVGWKVHMEGVTAGTEVELYFFPGGYVGVAPVGGGTVNVAALVDRSLMREAGSSPEGWLRAAAALHAGFAERVRGGRLVPGTEKAVAPVRISRKPRAWGNRFPLVGDAAMVVPPLCGDGMAMALRSTELCAPLADRYLRGEIGLERWRLAYAAALRKPFAGPSRWGRLLQSALGQPALSSLLMRIGSGAPELALRAFLATRVSSSGRP